MSMDYIRRTYNVPAKRGAKVEYLASDGELVKATIVGSSNGRLLVRLGSNKHTTLMHPTWALKYLPDGPEFAR